MSILRRYHTEGNIYFVTNVTYQRSHILIKNIDLIWKSIENIKSNIDFNMIAWVILPDHFHFIIDSFGRDISNIMQRVKMSFSSYYRSRLNMRTGKIWQNRFWDHIIRDNDDMNTHIDYIHFNPVKHGYTANPIEWHHSSFREYVEAGYYQEDWGQSEMIYKEETFGE